MVDLLSQSRGGEPRLSLRWDSVPGASSYNVLRARLSRVRSVGSFTVIEGAECLRRATASRSFAGPPLEETPPPGDAFVYLVESVGERDRGESAAAEMGEVVITSGDSCH